MAYFWEDFMEAKKIISEYTNKLNDLELRASKETNEFNIKLEFIGKQKLHYYQNQLSAFVDLFPDNKSLPDSSPNAIKKFTLSPSDIQAQTNFALDYAKILASGSTGSLAGFAAWSIVGSIGTAGTGASIATLTGLFQTNAILAALGGGTLASGGLGMAGGIAALGGLAASSILIVAPFVIKKLGSSNLEKANKFKKEIDEEYQRLTLQVSKNRKIVTIAESVIEALDKHQGTFNLYLRFCKRLYDQNNSSLIKHNSDIFSECHCLAQHYSQLLLLPEIDKNGDLKESQFFLTKIQRLNKYVGELLQLNDTEYNSKAA